MGVTERGRDLFPLQRVSASELSPCEEQGEVDSDEDSASRID